MTAVLPPLPLGEGWGEGGLRAREPSAKYLARPEPALIRGFELLATAPSGVATLRPLVLSLALQGKLVEQVSSDEPACALIGRISRANRRQGARLSSANLPRGWARVSFGDYANEINTGPFGSLIGKGDYIAGGVPLVNPSHMKDGHIVAETHIAVSREKASRLAAYRLGSGDIVFARRGEVGRTAVVTDREDGWLCGTGSFFARFEPEVNRTFLKLVFDSAGMRRYLTEAAVGSTMVNLNQRVLRNAVFDVPPLAEQHRIVARVEELMMLCDALEQSGRLADEQHARLTSTLFDALVASESADALAENWQRIAEHFDILLDRPEAIDAFEQTILQLAVRGLLVPQDASEESATVLVGRSGDEHDVARSASRPTGWWHVGFLDVCSVSGGSTPSKARADFWEGSIPWVSPKDMKRGVIADAIDHVSEQALTQTSLSMVPTGSVLVVVRGMILAHSFPTAITSAPVTINQDMKALVPQVANLAPYLALVCRGYKPEILAMVDRSTHGTCKLESSRLFGWKFDLPPLAEQHRIVARVEELRRLCAQLRERLTAARRTQSQLTEALVAEVG